MSRKLFVFIFLITTILILALLNIEKSKVENKSTKKEQIKERKKIYKEVYIASNVKKENKPKVSHNKQKRSAKQSRSGNNGLGITQVGEFKMPILDYVLYMESLGAKLLVLDSSKGKFIATIKGRKIIKNIPKLNDMSGKARVLTNDYPYAEELFKNIAKVYGSGSFEIIMLIPLSVSNYIDENIQTALRKKRVKKSKINSVVMKYYKADRGITIKLSEAKMGNKSIKLDYTFRL